MEYVAQLISIFLHLDKYLEIVIQNYGTWTYLILFLVVFAETGLVVTPFLPGDSLLFAAGSFAAIGSLNVHGIAALLLVAAIIGDALNYYIGYLVGPRIFKEGGEGFIRKHIIKKEYLDRTQRFYEKYGGKTVVIARFVPIVRTFAPFLAGVGVMSYPRFAMFNVLGAVLWVGLFVYGGYFFSAIPVVKNNFSLVIVAIIFVSLLPIVFEVLRARSAGAAARAEG